MSESNEQKTSVVELIERQRKANEPAPAPKPKRELSDLEKLLAKVDAERRARWDSCPVVVAGEVVDVEIGDTIKNSVWEGLTRQYPAALRADRPYEYDRGEVARWYPIDRIRVEGETPSVELWQNLFGVLSPDDRLAVEVTMWWIHIGEPNQRNAEIRNDHLREAEAAMAMIAAGRP